MFTRNVLATTAEGIACLSILDMDGDDDLDIVASVLNGNEVKYFINDGSETFTENTPSMVIEPNRMDAADMNGDGEIDVVIANGTEISLLINPLTGNTGSAIEEMIANVADLEVVDIDLDGDFDVVVASNMENSLSLYLNDGSGNFTKSLVDGLANLLNFKVADLDGDMDLDIVTSGSTSVTQYINEGSLNFSKRNIDTNINATTELVIVDVDGDSFLDIHVTGSQTQWYKKQIGLITFDFLIANEAGPNLDWVLTDENGIIKEVLGGNPPFNLDLTPLGQYNVYHIAYESGLTGLDVDSDIANLQGTFEISNSIMLSSAPCLDFTLLANNLTATDTTVCIDITTQNFNNITGMNYTMQWDSTFMCFDTVTNTNFNLAIFSSQFSLATADKLRFLWSDSGKTAPDGTLLYQVCFNIKQNNCSSMSSVNFIDDLLPIEIISGVMEIPYMVVNGFVNYVSDGGTIALSNGETEGEICVGDGEADILSFVNTSTSADNYTYVITDDQNVIFDIVTDSDFDFENTNTGICRVWGISHTGSFDMMVGETLTDDQFNDCFGVSDNFIEITKSDSGDACESGAPSFTIVLSRVSSSSQIFDIKNIGPDTIDVSDYYICEGPGQYRRIGEVVIECGTFNLNMAPGDVNGLNIGIDNSDGELAIYTNNDDFTNSDNMIHYVEWGSSGHARSTVAIAAGLWTANDFVSAFDNVSSIYFDGFGISSSNWTLGASNFCGNIPVQVVFNRVSDVSQVIDLKNISNQTIDVNDYFIKQGPMTYRVGDLVAECGETTKILEPGEIVGIVVIPMSNADGELALFSSSANATFNVISDYVQWGSGGHQWESVAVSHGVWTVGDFVPAIGSQQSIYYDGGGNNAGDWSEGATDMCGELFPNIASVFEYSIRPNPSSEMVIVEFDKLIDNQSVIKIVDSYGQKVFQKEITHDFDKTVEVDVSHLPTGIFYMNVKSKNKNLTKRFMIAK